jgi:septation ring formation regulator EzrA
VKSEVMRLLMEGVAEEVRAVSKRIDPIEGECSAQRWSSATEGETHRELEKKSEETKTLEKDISSISDGQE